MRIGRRALRGPEAHAPGRFLAAGLLALLCLLGGGCGCGDDVVPTPTPGPNPGRCCCTLQVEVRVPAVAATDVRVELDLIDPSLNPTIAPTFFPNVQTGDFLTTQICVDDTHALGALVTVRYIDDATNTQIAFVTLQYPATCTAVVNDAGGNGLIAANVTCP